MQLKSEQIAAAENFLITSCPLQGFASLDQGGQIMLHELDAYFAALRGRQSTMEQPVVEHIISAFGASAGRSVNSSVAGSRARCMPTVTRVGSEVGHSGEFVIVSRTAR
jgi:hypothetical protein